jgi:hypothetical protein
MKKIDLKKDLAKLYKMSPNNFSLVTVSKLNYLMIDGSGDPNHSATFQEAINALFTVSYTLKFLFKKGEQQIDYSVMPLEGLWWTDDMNNFMMQDKADWKWTMMILQPAFVTRAYIEQAIAQAAKRKELPMLHNMRLEAMEEGLCAQILHIGTYSAEGPDIAKLHDFIKETGYQLHGKHREIYLSDKRRTAPEKLKTIIRQPVI